MQLWTLKNVNNTTGFMQKPKTNVYLFFKSNYFMFLIRADFLLDSFMQNISLKEP